MSFQKATITTIITTYHRPQLLKRAIKSILNQTYTQFQLCVYDNASDDETSSLVHELMQGDSRIKYHRHEKNIGMMENYRFAFDKINTPYFHLLSDDDFLLPSFFETALQGFSSFPDAAFSACGIVQLQENGTFIGDPLYFWKQEGYYPAQKGALEMIKKHRYPIPTGTVFQTRFAKDIQPDFTQDIQVYWDPDYLIRIAMKYPIIINKTTCGVYLVHAHSFAYSVYSNIAHDPSNIIVFLQATHKLISKIPYHNMRRFFKKHISKDTLTFVKTYILTSKYGYAHFACKTFYQLFGLSFNLVFFHLITCLMRHTQILNKFLIQLVRHLPAFDQEIDPNQIKKYHTYGIELLQ